MERRYICSVRIRRRTFPMSRVERTENPSERRGSEQLRQAQRKTNRRIDSPGRTPGKAEGEESDVEQALESEQE
jgi:hypothetical protein